MMMMMIFARYIHIYVHMRMIKILMVITTMAVMTVALTSVLQIMVIMHDDYH